MCCINCRENCRQPRPTVEEPAFAVRVMRGGERLWCGKTNEWPAGWGHTIADELLVYEKDSRGLGSRAEAYRAASMVMRCGLYGVTVVKVRS